MRVNDKYSQCEFCKYRFNECTRCNPNYKATDSFELDERAYYDERRIRQDEREKILETISKVCTRENAKFCFQLDGKNYQVTQVGTIDLMEQIFRQEEREKIIALLKSDLENYDGIADNYVEIEFIDQLKQCNAVREYIESTIELLEKEQ